MQASNDSIVDELFQETSGGVMPTLAEVKFKYFAKVWKMHDGCHREVAITMDVTLKTVYNLVQQYGIENLDPSSPKRKRQCSKVPN